MLSSRKGFGVSKQLKPSCKSVCKMRAAEREEEGKAGEEVCLGEPKANGKGFVLSPGS